MLSDKRVLTGVYAHAQKKEVSVSICGAKYSPGQDAERKNRSDFWPERKEANRALEESGSLALTYT